MIDEYKDIKRVKTLFDITINEFWDNIFSPIENKAFSFYVLDFWKYFDKQIIDKYNDEQIIFITKKLIEHNGSWKGGNTWKFLKSYYDELQDNENQITENNLHPSIFEDGAFDIFINWINSSNDVLDKKISFIFQKLKKENKLRNTNFKNLSKWAFENNYIDKKPYDNFTIAGHFHSPSKILTRTRLALYSNIIGN